MQRRNIAVAGPTNYRTGYRFIKSKSAYLGVLPFLLLTFTFLLYPTYSVIVGAFKDENNKPNTSAFFYVLHNPASREAFINSIQLSGTTAIIGALIGGLFTWAIIAGGPESKLKKFSVSASGVLAQFGGVMLTFAFLATFGFNGLITTFFVKYWPESFMADPAWLYGLNGLIVVYLFFQIPLMFIVFLPAMENIRPQWREASESLGGNSREYWLRIGIPILFPSFLGSTLLLFANSFSAYATAAALISTGQFITPLEIANAVSSELGNANASVAKSLSLFMIAMVALIMSAYSLILRRVSKWDIK